MKSIAIIKRTASVHGFTLVEILVVIAITASPARTATAGCRCVGQFRISL